MNPRSSAHSAIAPLVLAAALAAAQLAVPTEARADGSLNVLTWCDHEDPTLLQPFEATNGVKNR